MPSSAPQWAQIIILVQKIVFSKDFVSQKGLLWLIRKQIDEDWTFSDNFFLPQCVLRSRKLPQSEKSRKICFLNLFASTNFQMIVAYYFTIKSCKFQQATLVLSNFIFSDEKNLFRPIVHHSNSLSRYIFRKFFMESPKHTPKIAIQICFVVNDTYLIDT